MGTLFFWHGQLQTYCWKEEVVHYKYGKSYEIISEEVAASIGKRKTSKTCQNLDGYNNYCI